jgi:hypothetical protein
MPHARPILLLALSIALLAAPLTAQSGGRRGGGMGGRRGGGMMGPNRRTEPMLDPVVVQGPPAPEDMARIAGLSDADEAAYLLARNDFMVGTKPQRDSLNLLRSDLRDMGAGGGGGGRDFERLRPLFEQSRRLGDALAKRTKEFDELLKTMLQKDQLKKYEKWRKEERKLVEKERERRRGRD